MTGGRKAAAKRVSPPPLRASFAALHVQWNRQQLNQRVHRVASALRDTPMPAQRGVQNGTACRRGVANSIHTLATFRLASHVTAVWDATGRQKRQSCATDASFPTSFSRSGREPMGCRGSGKEAAKKATAGGAGARGGRLRPPGGEPGQGGDIALACRFASLPAPPIRRACPVARSSTEPPHTYPGMAACTGTIGSWPCLMGIKVCHHLVSSVLEGASRRLLPGQNAQHAFSGELMY